MRASHHRLAFAFLAFGIHAQYLWKIGANEEWAPKVERKKTCDEIRRTPGRRIRFC